MTATEQPLSPTEQAALTRACNELPPRCREALCLLRSGETYEQIAAQLKIDEAQARLLVCRAMLHVLQQVTSVSLRSVPHKTLGAGEPDTKSGNKFSAALVGRNWGRS